MMVRRQSVAFIALLLGALVLAACGIDGEQRGPASTWGRGAEEWLANVQEAGREGVPNLEAFLTADVVLDHRGTGGEVAKGVGQSLSLVRHLEYTQPRTRLRPPPYLSRGGTVVPAVWEGPDLLTVQDAVLVKPPASGPVRCRDPGRFPSSGSHDHGLRDPTVLVLQDDDRRPSAVGHREGRDSTELDDIARPRQVEVPRLCVRQGYVVGAAGDPSMRRSPVPDGVDVATDRP